MYAWDVLRANTSAPSAVEVGNPICVGSELMSVEMKD